MRMKMEEMAHEFGDMLKETLDRMRERIEVNIAVEEQSGVLGVYVCFFDCLLVIPTLRKGEVVIFDRCHRQSPQSGARPSEHTLSFGRSDVENLVMTASNRMKKT